jgi:hypothetical protein
MTAQALRSACLSLDGDLAEMALGFEHSGGAVVCKNSSDTVERRHHVFGEAFERTHYIAVRLAALRDFKD